MALAVTVPFENVLRLGSKGTQPVAVKRGLWRAGFRDGWDALDGQAISAEVLGSLAVGNLKAFQTRYGLAADGVYGPNTHARLEPHFDDYARQLYTHGQPGWKPLQLPANFVPTHPTAGLPGYPARDFFARPGTIVLAPAAGKITKLSGHDPAEGGVPGGAYGWSIYLTVPHAIYFLTHFSTRLVELGQAVELGQEIGTVCDAAVAHMASSLSHIHEGKHVE